MSWKSHMRMAGIDDPTAPTACQNPFFLRQRVGPTLDDGSTWSGLLLLLFLSSSCPAFPSRRPLYIPEPAPSEDR
jgi:hypothetical protein